LSGAPAGAFYRMVENALPSPYLPHPCGLMHLPRVLEKIRRHWAGTLADYYAPTLGRGFDALLCEHLGIEFWDLMDAVRRHGSGAELDAALARFFPADLRAHTWNRKLVQRGLSGYSLERLEIRKRELRLTHRNDILTMCDLLEVAEGRLP
jgi:hypothetical protein